MYKSTVVGPVDDYATQAWQSFVSDIIENVQINNTQVPRKIKPNAVAIVRDIAADSIDHARAMQNCENGAETGTRPNVKCKVQHPVKIGFELLPVSSRSTITVRSVPSIPSAAA